MSDGPTRPPLRRPAEVDRVRPPLEADSVREAEEYAAKILDTMGDDIDQYNEFYVDPSVIPDGWSYEWKRTAVAGKQDDFHMLGLAKTGWRPVPAKRHPELMPIGWAGANIEKKGLQLMERPSILSDRARQKDKAEAREVIKTSEQKLRETPANTAPRDEFPEHLVKVKREFAAPRAE